VLPTKRSSSSPSVINVNNCNIDDPQEISQQFNNYFVNNGQAIANSIDKSYLGKSISQTIILDPPKPVEIFNIINSLNPNKASGSDNISSFFLRIGNEVLAPTLSLLFSQVFELGFFPNIMKIAKVVPIFKSGNKKLVTNYRLIFLLPTLSKVLEKLIKIRLVN